VWLAWVDARALGAISRGPGTTPTLMGLGNDPGKLVVIADAAAAGTNAVAFWRDAIPEGFEQKPGTKSRRIADPTRIELSRLTIEPSPSMLGYGVTFLNSTYPKPLPAGPGNAFTGGITPPAPLGIEKSTWNPDKGASRKPGPTRRSTTLTSWCLWCQPRRGCCTPHTRRKVATSICALDWNTGEVKVRLEFPDDSRRW
jgi:hypothetical protein